jgi:hypothetical protein
LVYIADWQGGIRIINASELTSPTEIGHLVTKDSARSVYVIDSLAYVAARDSGLRIINVSDPTNPEEIGFYDTEGNSRDIYVIDNLAYVADGGNGLRIINVSDPTNPEEIGFYDTDGHAWGIHVIDRLAYVADGDALRVINAFDPTNPVETGFYQTVDEVRDVYVVDSLAFVADNRDGLYIINYSGPIPGIPEIGISDSLHDFGDVSVVDSSDWFFDIYSEGGDTLEIDSLTNSLSVYTVLNIFPQSVPPRDTFRVNVRFKPDTMRIYDDTIFAYNNDSNNSPEQILLTGRGADLNPPVIESTTVWIDTIYAGPFEIRTKVSDTLSGVDSTLLYYKRAEDPDWVRTLMNLVAGWHIDTIPQVSNYNDTLKYYILSIDSASPANISTDPADAPDNYYSFISNISGIEESLPDTFSFSVRSYSMDQVIFSFSVPEGSSIVMNIYDIIGRIVSTPVDGKYSRGFYEVKFHPGARGVYFYILKSSLGDRRGKIIIF